MSTLLEMREALPKLTAAEKADLLCHLNGSWPGIVKAAGVCGGEACFVRTRIPVWTIVRAKQLGVSDDRLLESYPSLGHEDLLHAELYAAAHEREIQSAIDRNERE